MFENGSHMRLMLTVGACIERNELHNPFHHVTPPEAAADNYRQESEPPAVRRTDTAFPASNRHPANRPHLKGWQR
jgi:hypothetical protein